jgi:hypothetical protein
VLTRALAGLVNIVLALALAVGVIVGGVALAAAYVILAPLFAGLIVADFIEEVFL